MLLQVALGVQKIVFEQLGEDTVLVVVRGVERIAALALGTGCRSVSHLHRSKNTLQSAHAPKRDRARRANHAVAAKLLRNISGIFSVLNERLRLETGLYKKTFEGGRKAEGATEGNQVCARAPRASRC